MAKEKTKLPTELTAKEYIIPLRKEWRKVANYRRTGRAVKFIKQFIAKHMKIPDRDVSKVKLDQYLNQELWFRGRKKPPAKIKVKAIKEGDLINVELAEIPQHVKFLKLKKEKLHKPADLRSPQREAPQSSDEEARSKSESEKSKPKEEKSPEEKKEEKEKAQASAETKAVQAKQSAQIQKHAAKPKDLPIHRKSLKK